MRINTNIAAMTAQENASNVNKNLSSSLEKLSSGLRINKAADDASGMAIADKLRTQASSLGQSISNANSANALVQIADKAMAEQSNILDIVKTKLIQAATDTTSAEGREAIRKDVSKLLEQLDNIANQTNYNGINLLNTAGQELSFQVGEKAEYDIGLTTAFAANTDGLGVTESVLSNVDSTITYDNANGVDLKTNGSSITVGDSGDTSVTITGGTNGDSSFTVTGATQVTDITLAGAANEVTISTDDAALIAVLDSLADTPGGDVDLQRLSSGTYTFGNNSGDGAINFGPDGIDISKLSFSGVATAETVTFSTANPLTVTKDGGADPLNLTGSAALEGPGAVDAAGISYSDGATVTVTEGLIGLQVDQTDAAVTNAGIEITSGGTDASYTISADQVQKIGLASGDVTFLTEDSATKAALDKIAETNDALTKLADGAYTFSGTDAVIDFGEDTKVDISSLRVTGVDTAELLTVQTDEAVTVQKIGGTSADDVTLAAFALDANAQGTGAGTTAGMLNVTPDGVSISGALSELKNLGEGELTSAIANDFMAVVDTALNQINVLRSDFGSTQNQLDSFIRNAMTTQTNIKAAESVIRDVDYAAESANFNKQNIIAQAGTYAMSQANAVQQNVMRLLQ